MVKTYPAPAVRRREILRYAGVHGDAPELDVLISQCLEEIGDKLSYRVCRREFSVTRTEDGLDLGFAVTASKDLARTLEGCDRIVLFAATVGVEIDRRIARYAVTSPTKALLMQAIGAERVESLCDAFCRELAATGVQTRPRFSPGYGDLAPEMQKDIFAALDCPRRIGLTLNQSLLMSPTKSVTAIVGIQSCGHGKL